MGLELDGGTELDGDDEVDGGGVTAPHFAFWNPDGTWDVENHGVDPDIEVEMDPKLWRQGKDPQLDKAVEVVMEALDLKRLRERC